MKFSVDAETFWKASEYVRTATRRQYNSTELPLEAIDGKLRIFRESATGYASTEIDAFVAEPGRAKIGNPDPLKNLTGPIELALAENDVIVRYGPSLKRKLSLRLSNSPIDVEYYKEPSGIEVKLPDGVDRVLWAADSKDPRFCYVWLYDKFIGCTTDLICCYLRSEEKLVEEGFAIQVTAFEAKAERIFIDGRQVWFVGKVNYCTPTAHVANFLESRLKLEKMIEEPTTEATVDRDTLLQTLRLIKDVSASSDYKGGQAAVIFAQNLIFETPKTETGHVEEFVEAEISGQELTLGLFPWQWVEALEAIKSETATIAVVNMGGGYGIAIYDKEVLSFATQCWLSWKATSSVDGKMKTKGT